MKTNKDFSNFLFEIVDPATLIPGTYFCDKETKIGSRKSCYLMGTLGQTVTKDLLDYCYKKYYNDIAKAEFEKITKNWVSEKRQAFDCEGVLDCFAGVDINANMCYKYNCSLKDSDALAAIRANASAYRGAAFFKVNGLGKIHHVGFLAGIADNGDYLIIEAKGLRYGVIMSRYNLKDWQLCGIPDKLLSFDDKKKLQLIIDGKIIFDDFI